MSELTAILALKALDGLTLRSEVTSQNIANASSPGYRPLKVSFEEALTEAAAGGKDSIEALQPTIDSDLAQSSGVRLDLQMATASMTATRYAALVEILSRQAQLMRAVMGN